MLGKNELIYLIRDFYEQPAVNGQIIISRHIRGEKKNWVLESFQRIIRNKFFPDNGPEELQLDIVRTAVKNYSEGSEDLERTMELMFFFVENVVEFSKEYGGIDK
jgi:hypothetical protein